MASFACGQCLVPDEGQIIACRELGNLGAGYKTSRLAFTTFNGLSTIVFVPKENHAKITLITEFDSGKLCQWAWIVTVVASLLFNLAHGSLDRILAGLYMSTGYDPQARVIDGWNVVAVLQEDCTVRLQYNDTAYGCGWFPGNHGVVGGCLERHIHRKLEAMLKPVEKPTANMAARM